MKHILNKLGPAAPAANAQRYFPFEELKTEAEQFNVKQIVYCH